MEWGRRKRRFEQRRKKSNDALLMLLFFSRDRRQHLRLDMLHIAQRHQTTRGAQCVRDLSGTCPQPGRMFRPRGRFFEMESRFRNRDVLCRRVDSFLEANPDAPGRNRKRPRRLRAIDGQGVAFRQIARRGRTLEHREIVIELLHELRTPSLRRGRRSGVEVGR